MLGRRLGKWGGQLLGGTFIAVAFTAPTWPIRITLACFGTLLVAFERWRAPDSVERRRLEQQKRRDERRRRDG